MEKIQILFPEPQLKVLRGMAKRDDRPVSELVRAAVSFWIDRNGVFEAENVSEPPPVYNCGKILVNADQLRNLANEDRAKL